MDTPVKPFLILLKYIYTGELDFEELKAKDIIIELFTLAQRYGFEKLLQSMSSEAGRLLNVENVVVFLEAAQFYQLSELVNRCLDFLDEHSVAFLKSDASSSFLKAEAATLQTILSRNTFCAPESLIFVAIERWIFENPSLSKEEKDVVLKTVRLPLIEHEKLISAVGESGFYSWKVINEAIEQIQKNDEMVRVELTRFGCVTNINVFKKEVHLISPSNFDQSRNEVSRHELKPSTNGILIEIHKPYLVNKIRWKVTASLVEPVRSPFPAYDHFTIEVSLDGKTYSSVVERKQEANNCILFWSEKCFYFPSQVVQFIRIKAQAKNVQLEREMSYWFQVKSLELLYSSNLFEFSPSEDGKILRPKFNAAAIPFDEKTPKEDYFRADCSFELKRRNPRGQQIGGKVIEFMLEQLVQVNRVKLLLYDADPKTSYSFFVEGSYDDKTWLPLMDKRFEECRSWQEVYFAPMKLFYIRITGKAVFNANEDDFSSRLFKLIHFELSYK